MIILRNQTNNVEVNRYKGAMKEDIVASANLSPLVSNSEVNRY